MPYGHQSYPDPPVSIAFTSTIEQPVSASIPFLYPLPCHKFGYHTTSSVTSSVITHTASTTGVHGPVQQQQQQQHHQQQAHGYTHAADAYPQTPCPSLSYPAVMSEPVHSALPSVTATHCFSVPEQVSNTGVRGKQKTRGVRTAIPSVGLSGVPSPAPTPTSCLAKLLSSSARERKFSLSLNSFYF